MSIRTRESLDFDWRFHLGHASDPSRDFDFGVDEGFAKGGSYLGAVKADFDDANWRKVQIPHDWAVELDFCNPEDTYLHMAHGFKPVNRRFPETSIGWYRKRFDIPKSDEGRRLSIEFDGVFRDSRVWLNGHLLGRHTSGYIGFRYDITDFVNYGGENVLVVRADATQYEGWFYEGAGIYRHVWLVRTSPVHIPQWGTFVTAEVQGASATVTIRTEVENASGKPADIRLISEITDPYGDKLPSASASATIAAGETQTIEQTVRVEKADLWDIQRHRVYQLVSRVIEGEAEVDRYETTFGIRSIRFDANQGFFLNGAKVKILGTCNHQDHAGVGSAIPDSIYKFRLEQLKAMGSNAYRSAHNPPAPELLDLCDNLGFLVMDENRLLDSSEDVLAQLEALIRRDRNHPSIILWSIGNEEPEQGTERGKRIAETMIALVRKLDPTRPITYAGNNGAQYEGVNSIVDVRGWNYISIAGTDEYHKLHPEQPIIGSEEASTLSTRGEYVTDAERGMVSAYDTEKPNWGTTAEEWWQYFDERPYLAGGFVWTGFDYRGEPTPHKWPCISSHFGILDTCGFPKDNFFYYKSWWFKNGDLHIVPHWNWEGREGQEIDVWCYGNGDEVELLLNGKPLGKQAMPKNGHVEWKVPYEPGTLLARSFKDGKSLKSCRVETTGKPVRLLLMPDRVEMKSDGADAVAITVMAADESGRTIPTAGDLVSFEVENATIIGVGNGNPSSHERDQFLEGETWQRHLFHGLAQVIIRAPREPGAVKISASAPGLERFTAELEAKAKLRKE